MKTLKLLQCVSIYVQCSIPIPDCYVARLTVRRLRAADQQTFTLAVENERGADQLQVQLRVEGELRQLQPEQTNL